jgi:acyl carrier protein
MTPILKDIQSILACVLQIHPSRITADSFVRELPNMDSAAVLETVVAVEDHFGIELPDVVVLRLDRVSEIAEAVERCLVDRTGHAEPHAC